MSINAAAAAPAGSLLRNRFFQTVLLSNLLLQIGIWVRNFAILLYVTDKTDNDPIAVSLISVAEFAPIFVFSFIGGTFADRWRPKRTMIWCDFLSALSVFGVLLTLMFEAWEAVYFAAFLSAILSQFSQPSAMKLFKQHIAKEQLQSSMAIFQSLIGIFMVVGPSLGVIVYQNFGIRTSIAVMGVAFLLSALTLLRIPADAAENPAAAGERHFARELGLGFRYVWASPVLRTLCGVFALAGLSVGVSQTLGLFIVTERLGKTKEFLQFVMMVYGVAMLVGGATVVGVAKRISPQKMLALCMVVCALCTAGVGYSTSVPLTLVLQFVNGLMFPGIQIAISTMMLQWSEESYIGRVNGVMNPMFVGMMVVMMALSGPLKTVMPLVGIYAAAGVLFLAGALLMTAIFKYKAPEQAVPASVEAGSM